ncbi:MAG TPA: hypothetical protein P5137_12250, partial [Candidatus Brocadiia bacterium]|nr:hypothetical protein [Candidatus Brocadiia bacterium]
MNLIRNADMQAGSSGAPDGWTLRMWDGLETVGEMAAVEEAGRRALKLAWKLGGARFGAEAALAENVAGPRDLRFTAQAKTSGEGRAALLLEALDAKGAVAAQAESAPVAAKQWTPITLAFAVPAGAAAVRATCLNVGPGVVFFSQPSLAVAAPGATASVASFPLQAISQPAEGNAIWAGGQPIFNTFVDSPCSLTFSFWGRKGDLKDPAFVIETPEAVKVAELFNTHSGIRKAETPVETKTSRNGQPYRRYTYRSPAAFDIVMPQFAWNRELTAAFLPASPGAAGKDFDVFWWMESGGASSPEKRVIVRFLPPMAKTPNPKRFGYGGWGKEDMCFNDPALLKMVLRKYEEANMAGAPRGGPDYHRVDDLLVARGWRMKTGEPDYMHTRFLPFLAEKSELAKRTRYALSDRGKERKERVCPSFFIEDPEFGACLRRFVADKLASRRVRDGEMVSIDIEPWGTFEWCFCQHCRERFAREAGLKETPDTAAIINRFRKQWRDYKTRECEAVHRLVAACIRHYNPKLVIADYNYPMWYNRPGFESLFDSVPKDLRLYEDVIDAHLPSFYHYNKKEAFDLIDVVRRALKKPVWMTPSISRADAVSGSWTSRAETLSPKAFRQKMLGAAASGCGGVMVYPGDHLDGLFFVEIDRGMAWLA